MFVCIFLGHKAFELAPSLMCDHLGDYWLLWIRQRKVGISALFSKVRKQKLNSTFLFKSLYCTWV